MYFVYISVINLQLGIICFSLFLEWSHAILILHQCGVFALVIPTDGPEINMK
jgi:hypothetical protein